MLAEFIHPHIGGVEKHITEINNLLTRWGHEVMLWAPKHDAQLPSYENTRGVETYRVSLIKAKGGGAFQSLSWWFEHRALIRRADVVHFHGSYPFWHWFFPFRLMFPFKPMFITYHGCGMTVPPIRRERNRNRLTQFFTRGNICIGHFLGKWHKLRPTFVSYGGVNVPLKLPSSKEKTAVYVGRLDEDTGVELYLEALNVLRDVFNIELPLIICGDGPLKPELEKYCSDHRLDVTFKGFVENPSDDLARCQFAFVSGYLTLLEAMAARCLVFAVYKNRIREDYFKLMPESDQTMIIHSDPSRLAEALKRAWEDELVFQELRERGHAFASGNSWDKLANLYMRLWET